MRALLKKIKIRPTKLEYILVVLILIMLTLKLIRGPQSPDDIELSDYDISQECTDVNDCALKEVFLPCTSFMSVNKMTTSESLKNYSSDYMKLVNEKGIYYKCDRSLSIDQYVPVCVKGACDYVKKAVR